MKKLAIVVALLAVPASAQTPPQVNEPVCEPIGRTSKGDLVYSMECRNIPGLPPGDKPAGYHPAPAGQAMPAAAVPPTPPESR